MVKNELHPLAYAVILGLQKLGPQTKLQLMSRGLSYNQVESFIRCGILLREHNPATNLYYLRVPDDLFDS